MNSSMTLIIRSFIVALRPLAMLLCGSVWAGPVVDSMVEAPVAVDGGC